MTTATKAMIWMVAGLLLAGCGDGGRVRYPTTDQQLELTSVVLYRNGVGYFERRGEVDGDMLRLKVRKDQVNDLLKSLTIVDRNTGRAVSVSMPLDPQTWANVALATLSPGRGSLAEVLDALRGMDVVLGTTLGTIEGRIVLVEAISDEPDPTQPRAHGSGGPESLGQDHKLTLMDESEMRVVRLSKVQSVTLKDGDLAMQFHRRLDAAAGEGMFQRVDVAIRLVGDSSHDLVVSYVVEAPMWKPTYRVVLPKGGKGDALLQAWAVVDNTSGEDWGDVRLAVTAGAPIAFRYDLHTPRNVFREDLSGRGNRRRARVSMGETTYDEEAQADKDVDLPAAPPPELEDLGAGLAHAEAGPMGGAANAARPASRPAPSKRYRNKGRRKRTASRTRVGATGTGRGGGGYWEKAAERPATEAVSLEGLRRSTLARAKASHASGLTRFDIKTPVTVPDSTSTMVALVNQPVKGEETFMFKPGGAGTGYEVNPYRVVRFRNTTPFVLEPGPIAIYSGGSFVGEGISETVGAGSSATVPFAVETGIMVERESKSTPEELKLIKIVRGTIHVERFHQVTTIWKAHAQTMKAGYQVLIRHPKAGPEYKLKVRPEGTEDLPSAYLVPLKVPAGKLKGTIELVEQTPSRTTISIWNRKALDLLERLVVATNLGPAERAKLEPVIQLRREAGRIDTTTEGLRRQQHELDRRAEHHRQVLRRLKKDNSPEAVKLRRESTKALEEFGREGDRIGRELVKLEGERLRKTLKLEELLQTLTIAPRK